MAAEPPEWIWLPKSAGGIGWHWAEFEMMLMPLLGLWSFQATGKIGVAFALLD